MRQELRQCAAHGRIHRGRMAAGIVELAAQLHDGIHAALVMAGQQFQQVFIRAFFQRRAAFGFLHVDAVAVTEFLLGAQALLESVDGLAQVATGISASMFSEAPRSSDMPPTARSGTTLSTAICAMVWVPGRGSAPSSASTPTRMRYSPMRRTSPSRSAYSPRRPWGEAASLTKTPLVLQSSR